DSPVIPTSRIGHRCPSWLDYGAGAAGECCVIRLVFEAPQSRWTASCRADGGEITVGADSGGRRPASPKVAGGGTALPSGRHVTVAVDGIAAPASLLCPYRSSSVGPADMCVV